MALKNKAKSEHDFYVVGIGASAGGLDAYKRLLKAIPEKTGIAYVIVQHLNPSHASILPELLSKVTKIPVKVITDDIKLTPDTIFIIPENNTLTVHDGKLKLTQRIADNKTNMSIDLFFKSLAEVYTHKSIGVVLSGTAFDGTSGLKAIKENGGITFSQDLESATYNGMPKSAINADVVDFILPPEKIPEKILEQTSIIKINFDVDGNEHLSQEDEKSLRQIITILRQRSSVDFTYYKQPTIRRRIVRRMSITRVKKLSEYLELLRNDKEEQDALFLDVLIPVTSFFRDAKIFETLTDIIFPELLKKIKGNDFVRVWVAGCSSGEEAYSLAICLHEFLEDKLPTINIQVFATDISESIISKARTAIYTKEDMEGMPLARLNKYFTKTENGHYLVNKTIRNICIFAVHNFLKDPPFSKVDLVSCRNVLIYMEPYLQKKALTTFHYALNDNGYLLLGRSESVSSVPELFMGINNHDKLYLRKPTAGRFLPVTSANREETAGEKSNMMRKMNSSANDFQKSADDILLSRYTPPAVIINEQNDIVLFRGDTGFYLSPSPGKASLNLLKMARQGLSFELRNVLHKVQKKKITVIKENIPIQQDNNNYIVTIEIIPIANTIEPHYLVLFYKKDVPSLTAAEEKSSNKNLQLGAAKARIIQLEKELEQMREDIRSITEDQQASNEELQSANEELLSSSEELQTINEELETSKEELQSGNEELLVVNQELIERQESLNEARVALEKTNKQLHIQNEIFRQAEESCSQGHYAHNITTGSVSFSDNLYRMIGYEPGEFIPNLDEFILRVHEDDRAYVRTENDNLIREKIPSEWRYKMVKKNGEEIYIRGTGRVIASGNEQIMVGTIQDVTKETVNHKNLQLRESQLSESQRLGKTGSWEIDFINNKIKWSDEVFRMYNYAPDEIVVDMKTFGHLHKEDIPKFRHAIEHSKETGEPFELEYRRYDKEGNTHYIHSRGNVHKDKNNNNVRMLCISIDLTELREKEEYLNQVNIELEKKNAELENNNLELSTFSYAASHDLQEPLRKIQTFSKRLKEKFKSLPDDALLYLDKIENSSERMSILIKDLLDYSRVNNPEKLFSETNLNDTLKNVLTDFEVLIEQKKANIKAQPLPVIEAISIQMNQLFYNIIGNSLKFAKEGEKTLINITTKTLSAKEVKKYPTLNTELSYIEIVFKDNGIGFDPEYSKQIFNIFKRLHERTKYQGTGIGLSLSKKIVEIHNGCIFAESKENQGAEFYVILPVKQP